MRHSTTGSMSATVGHTYRHIGGFMRQIILAVVMSSFCFIFGQGSWAAGNTSKEKTPTVTASPAASTDSSSTPTQTTEDSCDRSPHHHRVKHLSYGFGFKSLDQSNENSNRAYTNNSLPTPKRSIGGMNLLARATYKSNIVSGFDMGWLRTSKESGNFEGTYGTFYFGIFGGYEFMEDDSNWSIVPGLGLGYAITSLEILSSVADGRVTNRGLYLEPGVKFGYHITPRFEMGLNLSHFSVVGSGRSTKGDDLGVNNISPRGWSLALLFLFSHR